MTDFGTREHQKVIHLIVYSSPSYVPKLTLLSGIVLKKPLVLKVKKYRRIY
jgi:hypothetical protein